MAGGGSGRIRSWQDMSRIGTVFCRTGTTVMCPRGKIEGLGTASKPVATVTQPMLMYETSMWLQTYRLSNQFANQVTNLNFKYFEDGPLVLPGCT